MSTNMDAMTIHVTTTSIIIIIVHNTTIPSIQYIAISIQVRQINKTNMQSEQT